MLSKLTFQITDRFEIIGQRKNYIYELYYSNIMPFLQTTDVITTK